MFNSYASDTIYSLIHAAPLDSRMFIDTHCHLDMNDYHDDLPQVLDHARIAGVGRIVTIGIDLESSETAAQLAAQYPGIHGAVGIHPHHASEASETTYMRLQSLAASPHIVGWGEIGLDYAKEYSPRETQLREFATQLRIAKKLGLPVIIHDREAHADTLNLLRQFAPFPTGGVMHCFSGDSRLAQDIIALGFYISIPGIVTFPKSAIMQQVVRDISLEHILLETDGPFLAPVPFRGKRNTPAYLCHTAKTIAQLKEVSVEEVASRTTRNASALFGFTPQTPSL